MGGVILLASCSKEQGIIKTVTLQNYKANIVSEEFAKTLASHINPLKYTNLPTKSQLKVTQKKAVRPLGNSYTIKDKKNNPALYIVTYTNDSGFAIISAEKEYNPICAYIPKGSIKKDTIPIGLAKWFSTTLQHIELVRTGKYNNKNNAAANWKHVLEENELGIDYSSFKVKPDDPVDPPVDPDCNSPYYTTQRGPFITTEWDQDCFYNDSLPATCTEHCGHVLTGCVSVAVAQIVRFWQPTNNDYNYDYSVLAMPNNALPNSSEIQRLMKDAAENLNTTYGCDKSSSTTQFAREVLVSDFGFHWDANYCNYNYLDVVDNMNQVRPMILNGTNDHQNFFDLFDIPTGEGHTWICDGYIQSSNQCYGFLNFHMNWGWYGNYNGWYLFDNWLIPVNSPNIPPISYQYSNDMVKDIHP